MNRSDSPFDLVTFGPRPAPAEYDPDSEDESQAYNTTAAMWTLIHQNGTLTLYNANARIFLNTVSSWSCNRKPDPNWIKQLTANIKKDGLDPGTIITVARLPSGEIYIVDGAHRQIALLSLLQDSKINYELLVRCYDLKTEEEIVEKFKLVNASNPLDPKESPSIFVSKIVDAINIHYKNGKRVPLRHTKKAQYPYISIDKISSRLREFVNQDNWKKILRTIKKINSMYANAHPLEKQPWCRHNLTTGQVTRAAATGFYLGLDEKFTWMDLLKKKYS